MVGGVLRVFRWADHRGRGHSAHSVEGALVELAYAQEQLGIKAAWTRPNPVHGKPLGSAEFDPFFEALANRVYRCHFMKDRDP